MAPRGSQRGGKGGRGARNGAFGKHTTRSRGSKPTFSGSRLAQDSEEDFSGGESDLDGDGTSVELGGDVSSIEDSGEEDGTAEAAYLRLVQSLRPNDGPSTTKKRKFDDRNGHGIPLEASKRPSKHGAEKRAGEVPNAATTDEEAENQADADREEKEGKEEGEDEREEEVEHEIDNASDDETEDRTVFDPFKLHFEGFDDATLTRRITAVETSRPKSSSKEHPEHLKTFVQLPSDHDVTFSSAVSASKVDQSIFKIKLRSTAESLLKSIHPPSKAILPYIFNYQDVLLCTRTHTNASDLLGLTCLHALNHILKTRDRVLKNNERLAREAPNEDVDIRDQGFARPKVLFLLPTRDSCAKVVEVMVSLFQPEQQENKKRFQDTYVGDAEKFSDQKPADFRDMFSGNDDDMFRLGLKFTRKTMKFFSQFYNSDVIFASPLGLRMAIGMEKKQDHDFLSSIELVVIDNAAALLMQNWEHVEYILEHLNMQPKEAHGCDFSRVRPWYLNNQARHLRQTLVFSPFNTPELNQIFSKQMLNVAGRVKITPTSYHGMINDTHLPIHTRQKFSRLDSSSPAADPDVRFEYFVSAIAPSLAKKSRKEELSGKGTLLFVPSYLDFVRLRNYFSTAASLSHISFGSISEYSSVKDVARARSHFSSGRHAVLLYTERAHHFRRYRIRGVQRVIFYGLPENSIFYQETVGGFLSLNQSGTHSNTDELRVRCLYSRWDALKLERVVGTKRMASMLKGDVFDFI